MFLKYALRLLIFFALTPFFAAAQGGLKFHGSEEPINQRTSYDVFGGQTARFHESFDVDFNLALYPTTEFGYILRIKNKDSNRIYNLFYDGQANNVVFRLNEEGTHSLIVAEVDKTELLNTGWFNVRITFDLTRDSIRLNVNNHEFRARNDDLPDTYSPVVVFGRSDHVIDVPSFAIKDLSIGNSNRFHFELKEIEGETVHDADGREFGTVTNPEWLMNDAYHWRHKASFKSQSVAGANYVAEKKEVYYFSKDTLITFNVRSGQSRIETFEQEAPMRLVLGTNFVDARSNKLYAYEVYYAEDLNYDGPSVASLDLNTYTWNVESSERLPMQLHHHGSYFDPIASQYTIFGGFGNMRYNKNFFRFDLNSKAWSTLEGLSGDVLNPRYFSSVGYLKKTNAIYVFGGMGNESGEQIVGRKYYYDLHKVDLNTNQVSKLWEIEWKQDNMVPVRGMVILDDSTFYTLCYPEHFSQSYLRLYRFSMKDGQYEILGDSIPIRSDKITTNANLYFDQELGNLYALVQEFEDDISSDLKVYSLAFPPITASELSSYAKEKDDLSTVVILIAIVFTSALAFLLYRKRKPKEDEPAVNESPITITVTREKHFKEKPESSARANSIYLFGDFVVRDRKNHDITYMLSAQLKQAFCLILQYSTTEGGIASQRFSSIMWPDKSADKAKNSRGVTINHLRKVLSELDGVELIYEKGSFKLEYTDALYCDYIHCLKIISDSEISKHRNDLVEILNRGRFLQLFDHPLFDSFKEEMEKKLEPVIVVEMEKSFEEDQLQTVIALAEALFRIDPLNDTALIYEVQALQKMRMHDEAKLKYQSFVIEYKKVMGTDYPHPYRV